MSASREVLEAALKLEPEERVELAHELMASVDAASVDPDFARELERRIQEVESGAVTAVPWEDVKARLESRLRRGR